MIHAVRKFRLTHILAGTASPHKAATFAATRGYRVPVLLSHASKLCANDDSGMSSTDVLPSTHDRYDGIQIDADGLPSDPSEFAKRLTESLLVSHKHKYKAMRGAYVTLKFSSSTLKQGNSIKSCPS